ncbi:hypothetical protein AAEX28_15420 [Lentisphaerota bacterium WC36G]|nr:hypothetical protein LJT99_02180 [Lentisphaerae bacterium WC36]
MTKIENFISNKLKEKSKNEKFYNFDSLNDLIFGYFYNVYDANGLIGKIYELQARSINESLVGIAIGVRDNYSNKNELNRFAYISLPSKKNEYEIFSFKNTPYKFNIKKNKQLIGFIKGVKPNSKFSKFLFEKWGYIGAVPKWDLYDNNNKIIASLRCKLIRNNSFIELNNGAEYKIDFVAPQKFMGCLLFFANYFRNNLNYKKDYVIKPKDKFSVCEKENSEYLFIFLLFFRLIVFDFEPQFSC